MKQQFERSNAFRTTTFSSDYSDEEVEPAGGHRRRFRPYLAGICVLALLAGLGLSYQMLRSANPEAVSSTLDYAPTTSVPVEATEQPLFVTPTVPISVNAPAAKAVAAKALVGKVPAASRAPVGMVPTTSTALPAKAPTAEVSSQPAAKVPPASAAPTAKIPDSNGLLPKEPTAKPASTPDTPPTPLAKPAAPEAPTPPISAGGWDNNLPNGGRAIGVVTSGISTGNSQVVKHKSSRRFMATRSGVVKSFGYHNRILSESDIELRAETRRTSEPIWAEIQQAFGNDPKRGGYMLSNSYSVGNGGLQEVTLQTDDGTPDHNPSGTVIAKADPYVPFDLPAKKWAVIDFQSPGNVQAGQLYHLVYENLNPPSTSIRGLSVAEARNAPTDKGAISLDGTTDGIAIDPAERHGPFLRNFPATLIKKSASSAWEATNVTSWYSLVYADGVEAGETYAHFQGKGDYRYAVDGNKQLRQEFTWNYPTTSVDRIVTRFGLDKDANGRPMSIVFKSQSLSTIATASVPFDSALKAAAQSSNTFVGRQTRHSVASLSSTVQLIRGQKYYVQYSAPSGAGYVLAPAIETDRANGNSDHNLWGDGLAKQSTDSGSSWKGLDVFPDSDMPMYLIPVGIPTQTPAP